MSVPSDTGTTDAATAGHARTAIDSDGVPVIRMRNVAKRFRRSDGSVVNAIDGVSFDVHKGEFVVLLGPSGCGKTTLLRTIAGLEQADEGLIDIRGRTVFSSEKGIELAPERRGLSMIFQSYALWPHMTAFANVAYPLKSRREEKLSKDEVRERVEKVLALVGVSEVSGQYPNQMSGGQQQRVALARALVGGDDLVLFDEPLSNVDAKVRESLRRELLEMQRELGFAAVYVTHDQNEAMELAHRVAVMGSGRVRQLGAPHEIYLGPTSRYVANFVGVSNELPGVVTAVSRDGVGTAEVEVSTAIGAVHGVLGSSSVAVGDQVVASFRPEHGQVSTTDPGDGINTWRVGTERMLFLGPHTERVVAQGQTRLRLTSPGLAAGQAGEIVWLRVDPAFVRVLPAEDGADDASDDQ